MCKYHQHIFTKFHQNHKLQSHFIIPNFIYLQSSFTSPSIRELKTQNQSVSQKSTNTFSQKSNNINTFSQICIQITNSILTTLFPSSDISKLQSYPLKTSKSYNIRSHSHPQISSYSHNTIPILRYLQTPIASPQNIELRQHQVPFPSSDIFHTPSP